MEIKKQWFNNNFTDDPMEINKDFQKKDFEAKFSENMIQTQDVRVED